MKLGPFRRRTSRQSGYILLVLMFFMALLVIAALASAPDVATQLKRDREEEMIHRGAQYARAIKHYVKKFGRYPTSLEQLEGTNNVRFLRKRYADPMTKDGKWRLLYATDVKFASPQQGGLGTPAAQLAAQSSQSPSGFGTPIGQQPGQSGLGLGTTPGGLTSPGLSSPGGLSGPGGLGGPGGLSSGPGGLSSSPGRLSSGPGGLSPSPAQGGRPGVTTGGTAGAPVFGAGAIVGVASVSDKEGLREFNQKSHYNEWFFAYDFNTDSGGLIKGPYTGKTFNNGGKPLGGQPSSLDPHSIAPSSSFGMQPSTLGSPSSSSPKQ